MPAPTRKWFTCWGRVSARKFTVMVQLRLFRLGFGAGFHILAYPGPADSVGVAMLSSAAAVAVAPMLRP